MPDARKSSLTFRHVKLFSIRCKRWTIDREREVFVPDHSIGQQIVLEEPAGARGGSATIVRNKERCGGRIDCYTAPSRNWQADMLDLGEVIVHVIDIQAPIRNDVQIMLC